MANQTTTIVATVMEAARVRARVMAREPKDHVMVIRRRRLTTPPKVSRTYQMLACSTRSRASKSQVAMEGSSLKRSHLRARVFLPK